MAVTLTPSEIFFMAIGILSIVAILLANIRLLRAAGLGLSVLEALYYVTALAALVFGWYFNFQYFRAYGAEVGWVNWTELLFANPASASGGQDLIIANLILYPLWTISDGRRVGMRAAWLYFPMSLLTSYAFGVALYLALRDRQLRWAAMGAGQGAGSLGLSEVRPNAAAP